MTTTAAEAPGVRATALPAPGDGTTAGQRMRRRWQRWRWPLAVSAVVLVAAGAAALLTPRTTTGDLDPGSASPSGTRAVAQILAREGVPVQTVRRSTDLDTSPTMIPDDERTTLVVVHPQFLGPRQLDRIVDGRAGYDLVLVEPDAVVLDRLVPGVYVAGTGDAEPAAADCDDPDVEAAGQVLAGGHRYRTDSAHGTVCYRTPDGSPVGNLVRTQVAGQVVTVLGQADLLRNSHLAEGGNAALALRLLGARPRVTWYLADPLELAADGEAPTLSELVPPWVSWVTLQVGLAALLAMVWRARRLGPLVKEPLPVVVRAAETQEGRARLYRQAHATGRAAATLRTAAARRLASRLNAPADATAATLVLLVAQATRTPAKTVHALLLGYPPPDDAGLVRLAGELDALEQALGPPGAGGTASGGTASGSTASGSTASGSTATADPTPTDETDRKAAHR